MLQPSCVVRVSMGHSRNLGSHRSRLSTALLPRAMVFMEAGPQSQGIRGKVVPKAWGHISRSSAASELKVGANFQGVQGESLSESALSGGLSPHQPPWCRLTCVALVCLSVLCEPHGDKGGRSRPPLAPRTWHSHRQHWRSADVTPPMLLVGRSPIPPR